MIIATHNGTFHADETTACAILTYLFENSSIIRSRDPEELEKADINGMKQSIDTIADVASAALGELRNRLDEQEKINSYMFNLLYSKIKELETKIK